MTLPQRMPTGTKAKPYACRRGPGRAVGLLALLGLAACTGTGSGSGVVYNTNFTAGYSPPSLAATASRGGLLVETYGTPAGAELTREDITQATVRGLRSFGPTWFPRNFTGNPEDVPRPDYLLRIVYGTPRAFNRQQLCSTGLTEETVQAARSSASEVSTRAVAGLCRGERAIAQAEGSPGTGPDINGERFSKFVGLLGRQVMPRRNPVTQDDCLFRRCD